jgi:hypothetical protein
MILVDGNLLAHRAYHKLDEMLSNDAGTPTGMEYGFLRSLEYLEKTFPDDQIVLVFDTKRNFKRERCARYKAGRSKMESTFHTRLEVLVEFCHNWWDTAWEDGIEADDILYTLASDGANGEEDMIIYSNDNDLLQCVDDKKKISVLKSHGSQLFKYDEEKVEEKFLVVPELLPLFRSFVGDKSDNLDGVKRIQKSKLADAIMLYIEIVRSKTKPALQELDNPIGFFDRDEKVSARIAEYTGWSLKMQLAIEEHVKSGNQWENYELMKLEHVVHNYRHKAPQPDDKLILSKLREWQIGSLRLSEPYKSDIVDPASEF